MVRVGIATDALSAHGFAEVRSASVPAELAPLAARWALHDHALIHISEAAHAGQSLEQLARPLLDILREITGLDAVYLTQIHWAQNEQEVLFVCGDGRLPLAEGIKGDWADSLCRRVLLGAPGYTDDAAAVFPDSAAVRELGLQTFVSCPIVTADKDTFGTLCGAGTSRQAIDDPTINIIRLAARLLADQVSRDRQLVRRRERIEEGDLLTSTDPLTGLPNRQAFDARWQQEVARSARYGYPLSVTVVEIDRFKALKDADGYAVADTVLRKVARALAASLRHGDVLARVGVAEFAVGLPEAGLGQAEQVAQRLAGAVAAIDLGSYGKLCHVNCGIACSASTRGADLLEAAHRALDRVTGNGKSRIEVWEGPLR